MDEIIHIIYHADWDGIVAAWVARNALKKPGVSLEFHSINYGHKPPGIPGHHDVYILDFAFPPEVFAEFCRERTGRTVQLDHHKTAFEKYAARREESGQKLEPGRRVSFTTSCLDEVIFEGGEAGCMMTWVYMLGGYDGKPIPEPPPLAQYAADHDLWHFGMPHSRTVRAAMRSYPQTLESCDELNTKMCEDLEGLVEEGTAIERFMKRQIESACRHAELMEMDGHRCWAAQVPFDGLISEVAGELAKKEGGEFGVCWFKLQGTQWNYSLRSRGDFDVSEVAKKFGGGGHAKAAGFASMDSPICFLSVQEGQ